jgi:hypothetical protein
MERTNASAKRVSTGLSGDRSSRWRDYRDKTFVERSEPAALHGEEGLEEDSSFLSVGSETWDYQVASGKKQEFLNAVRNSRMALECIPLES